MSDDLQGTGVVKSLAVRTELVSIEGGVWCDACASHSGHRVWFAVTIAGRMTLQDRVACEAHAS